MNRFRLTCFLSFFLFSCSDIPEKVEIVLESAGENRMELDAVIKHYQATEDSLKLKATYFLIGNMGTKWGYKDVLSEHCNIVNLLDSINKKTEMEVLLNQDNSINNEAFSIKNYFDSLKDKNKVLNIRFLPIVKDIDVVTKDFLIENIDLAFETWQTKPWAKHINFEDFCEYILPYRVNHEPLESWRKKLKSKYEWINNFPDTTKENVLSICSIINDSLKWFKNDWVNFGQLPDLKISDLYKTRIGTCYDMSTLSIYVMRSQGLPVGQVIEAKEHTWNIVIDSDSQAVEFQGTSINPDKLNHFWYRGIPRDIHHSKVHLMSYANIVRPFWYDSKATDIPSLFRQINLKDITGKSQTRSADIKLSLLKNNHKSYVYLAKFDLFTKDWEAVSWSVNVSEKANFPDMGLSCIYLPIYFMENQYIPAGSPFYIDNQRKITKLKPDNQVSETITVYRKIGMGKESAFAKSMVGAEFHGSNESDFEHFTKLFTIKNLPSKMESGYIENKSKFRYVRYFTKNIKNLPDQFENGIAELVFYDAQFERLQGSVISSQNLSTENVKNAFDNNIRTNFNSDSSCWIGLDLGKPYQISKVKYLFRNSFNTIEAGDEYELLYWDNKWLSLGKKVADKDYLKFRAPKNAVFWIKNLTKGRYEQIFMIKNGKQVWG